MFSHRLTTIAGIAIGAAVVGLGTAAQAGATTAVSPDEVFIAQISNVGISFTSPQEAIRSGHSVCAALAAGRNGGDIAREILSESNLTPRLAALFVIDATQAYCPQLRH
jgi:hypothetical protein